MVKQRKCAPSRRGTAKISGFNDKTGRNAAPETTTQCHKKQTAAGQPDRRELANAIRALSMDAVQAANSGHPGAPMGMADIAEVLWNDYPEAQPGQPRVVRSRPLRAVERSRLDAALQPAAPDRLSDCRSMRFAISASSAIGRRATPSTNRGSVSRPRPARWGRASPMPSAWRWPRKCWRATVQSDGHDIVDHKHLGIPRATVA